MKKLRIAYICPWQNHSKKFADLVHSYEESCLCKVWDDDVERGKAFAAMYEGCEFEPKYETVLQDKNIDGLIITSPIHQYESLIIPALEAGKNIFVEKPMATDELVAEKICNLVNTNNIHFTVSDPIFTPPLQYLKKLILTGELGEVKYSRARIVFGDAVDLINKPELKAYVENRGGAMFDSHSAHVLLWLLGRPQSAIGVFNELNDYNISSTADVQSLAVYQYEDGSFAVGEASYISNGSPYRVEVYGTKGSAYITREHMYINLGDGYTMMDDNLFPEKYPYPLHYWIQSIFSSFENTLYTAEEAKEVTKILSTVYKSNGSLLKI